MMNDERAMDTVHDPDGNQVIKNKTLSVVALCY